MPTFLPGPTQPPFPYSACRTLRRAPPEFSLPALASRIGLFARDSLLASGAGILWRDFEDRSRAADRIPLLGWERAFAAQVMSLALMYGGGNNDPWATEQEFVNLEWELLQMELFLPSDSMEARGQRAAIRAGLVTVLPRLAQLHDEDVGAIRALWNLAGGVAPSAVDTDADPSTLVRDYLIYAHFREQYGGNANWDFLSVERAVFLTTPRLFLRAAYLLLSLGQEARPTRGMIEFYHDESPRELYPEDVGFDDMMVTPRATPLSGIARISRRLEVARP